ncbi:hypothetical protein PVAP13_2NG260300 [Panicum virgatum]|uniref:Uncharacterized protein n=1 Tax=Panicum virgatum TaxID=38727 RepID=A0A8T0VEN9_PANVG|nr:hypothetical protein PVAP13_2NG260300 [Panicum virgatum]
MHNPLAPRALAPTLAAPQCRPLAAPCVALHAAAADPDGSDAIRLTSNAWPRFMVEAGRCLQPIPIYAGRGPRPAVTAYAVSTAPSCFFAARSPSFLSRNPTPWVNSSPSRRRVPHLLPTPSRASSAPHRRRRRPTSSSPRSPCEATAPSPEVASTAKTEATAAAPI